MAALPSSVSCSLSLTYLSTPAISVSSSPPTAKGDPIMRNKTRRDAFNRMFSNISPESLHLLREFYKDTTHYSLSLFALGTPSQLREVAKKARQADTSAGGLKHKLGYVLSVPGKCLMPPVSETTSKSDRGVNHAVLRDALVPWRLRNKINARVVPEDHEEETLSSPVPTEVSLIPEYFPNPRTKNPVLCKSPSPRVELELTLSHYSSTFLSGVCHCLPGPLRNGGGDEGGGNPATSFNRAWVLCQGRVSSMDNHGIRGDGGGGVHEGRFGGCSGRLQARVVVVSNACQSDLLCSKRWTLVCAAGAKQKSYALAQSASGYVRGSMFTQCTTAQIAHDVGLQMPRPRADKRSATRQQLGLKIDDIVKLPLSPPLHSLSPPRTIQIQSPTDQGILQFMEAVNSRQDYLLFDAAATFQVFPSPSADALPWHHILPSPFNEAMVASLSLYLDNLEVSRDFFGTLPQLQGGSSPKDPDLSRPKQLEILAATYVQKQESSFTPEAHDITTSGEPCSEEQDFLHMLRCRNVQSVAVQHIARALGWWEGEVASFVLRPFGDYRGARMEMTDLGMFLDLIPEELHRRAPWISPVEEPPATLWLVSRWLEARSPSVSSQLWHATEFQRREGGVWGFKQVLRYWEAQATTSRLSV
ncbi:hypothetical protein B0H17DRAFT_1126031 [Mycena rosella]|uniref:Uncharacterized protein n=1 Tax=Mycena rosella TaxID=1033263 RepID=A0AAD7GVS0_MYCRO|nr:hypothetical protein B0H17DRAFT_1126031 [Mycena rosella]